MRELKGRVAIITGASRGIGVHVARALAGKGTHLALAARNTTELEAVRAELSALGVNVVAVPTDVCDPAARQALFDATEAQLGPPDILVNNAGMEAASAYEKLSHDEIQRFIDINLAAPMHLTRLVLPGMLERDRGHIVNIASLAGLGPTAFGEPYGATKHGLVGFTKSLRASSKVSGSNVSASAICPGYVRDVGMYQQMQDDGAEAAGPLLGTSSPQAVAAAVLRAIHADLPDVVVNPGLPRLMFALMLLFPRFGEWAALRTGSFDVFKTAADARGRGR